jgi:signal transduction histidine kinase
VARRLRDGHGASAQARDPKTGWTWEVSGNLVPDEEGRGRERAIVVARDITRLVELQESVLREARMSAMGSLVAGVAHEVRNPLFGISSTLDAFEARHGRAEPFQKYLNVLRREVDRLGALMRDLLDYGRPPVLDIVEVDFEGVVDEALRLCETDAEAAGVRIVKTHGWGVGEVPMDRWRIVQVLQNLIQNAIQHSPQGGSVAVSGGAERGEGGAAARCSIRDEGSGFDPADLPRLFEPFFTRRRGGTGLGLSIAQRIVSQHGGTLEASNHPEGGAVVSLKLPIAAAAQAPRPA